MIKKPQTFNGDLANLPTALKGQTFTSSPSASKAASCRHPKFATRALRRQSAQREDTERQRCASGVSSAPA
jgi:hypothetical protein